MERGTQHGGLAGRAQKLTENIAFKCILTVLLHLKCLKNMPYCLILRDESPSTQSSPLVGNVCVKSLIQNQAFSKECPPQDVFDFPLLLKNILHHMFCHVFI